MNIATFRKNAREEIRVSLDQIHGLTLVNMRTWYLSDGGEMWPGKQGLAVRPELLPELVQALTKAADAATVQL